MAVPKKIINFLEKNKIKYEIIKHRIVYSAYDKAKTLKVPEKIIGKTLILKINGNLSAVLIPANKNLDFQKIKKIAKIKKLDFASEKVIKNKFKGVKVGAVPPFGGLWGISTFIDRSLIKQPKIIINSGDYNFSIKISGASLKKIVPDLIIESFNKPKSR
jgi:Ala-tRNA(Pro) deacylase